MSLIKYILKENNISNIINDLSQTLIGAEDCKRVDDINRGYCADFANMLNDKVGGQIIADHTFFWDGIFSLETDDKFIKNKYGHFLVGTNNKPICLKYNSKPPIEYTKVKSLPHHVWVYYNGKHYDATTPNGVRNFFGLDIFNSWDITKTVEEN